MRLKLGILAVLVTAAGPALADGDAAKGEAVFRQCQTCHTVTDPEGKVLAGRNGKVGPNLYGVIGRTAGTYEGFNYGESIVAAGAAGLVWNEADLVAYVQDPGAFLKEKLGDSGAKSQMAFKVRNETMAQDVYAFLAQFGATPTN